MKKNLRLFYHTYFAQMRRLCIAVPFGIGYYLLTRWTPLRIPCLFQKLTGFACPGCGVTHFFIRLFQGDLAGALSENFALAVLTPLWLAAILIRALWNPRWFSRHGKAEAILLWGSVVFLLLFGVVRNLPQMTFLLPSYLR